MIWNLRKFLGKAAFILPKIQISVFAPTTVSFGRPAVRRRFDLDHCSYTNGAAEYRPSCEEIAFAPFAGMR